MHRMPYLAQRQFINAQELVLETIKHMYRGGRGGQVVVSQATPFSAYSASLWEKGLATAIYQACVLEMLGLMMSQT